MKKTSSGKKGDNENNNIININDSIESLPTYSLEVYEDDYFKELILEPLSFLTSGDVIVVSTNSPIKNKSPIKKDKEDDESSDDSDDNESNSNSNNTSSTSQQYYCPFCKKKFQTEQTWNTHINSTKHLNSIKEQKKKSTTTSASTSSPSSKNNNNNNNTPTKQSSSSSSLSSASPLKNNTSNSKSNSNNQKDNEFIQDQIIQTQQAIKIKTSKPNLACKNLFNIARSYSQRQYIKDSAKTLNLIIEILSSQQQQQQPQQSQDKESPTPTSTPNYSLDNILNSTTLLCKTHLYFGRLTRLFKQSLSEFNFISSFNNLFLISNEQLQKYETFLSNNKSPFSLYKIFLKQLSESSISQDNITDKEKEQLIIQLNNYLNEISGGLCYCKVNYKSIIIYILASCITYKFKMYRESLESNSRAFKLLSSLKQYHWSIDLLLNNLIIKLKLIDGEENNSQEIQDYFENLILLILKYCILIDDKIRLNDILNDLNFKKVISLFSNNNEIINCLIESSWQFLNENYKEIENLKDKYEHLIYSNKEIIFIFNQFDLKRKILLLK